MVDFRVRVAHSSKGNSHRVKEYKKLSQTKLNFQDFSPSLAFVPIKRQFEGKYVIFLEKKLNDNEEFELIRKLYEFNEVDDHFDAKEVTNGSLLRELAPKALKDLHPKLQVIGIIAQSSWKTKNTGFKYDEDYGLIILFKINMVIKYCWTEDKQLSDMVSDSDRQPDYRLCELDALIDCDQSFQCNEDKLKTLIDCNKFMIQELPDSIQTQQLLDSKRKSVIDYEMFSAVIITIILVSMVVASAAIVYWKFRKGQLFCAFRSGNLCLL